MILDLIPYLTFMTVTTFTPGPNNITSAALGMNYGFKTSLKFMGGVFLGFLLIQFLSAMLSSFLLVSFPALSKWLSYVGAAYILWLAYGVLKMNINIKSEQPASNLFIKGFLLQPLNPKGIIYSMTIFSTFLAPYSDQHLVLLAFVMLNSLSTFAANALWAVAGKGIKATVKNQNAQKVVNTILALLLVYSATVLVF